MDIFNTFVLIVVLISVFSWIKMILDIKKNPLTRKIYNLNYSDINEIKDRINNMEGRQFEKFCNYLFNKTGQYKSVVLTPAANDEGRDIILTTHNDEVIYVECKRYTDSATKTEDYMIGREICQKLIGSMVANSIKHGIIITTGSIHQNAWDYINKLETNNPWMKLDIIDMDMIIKMIREYCDSSIYSYIYA